jgi:CBS domain-containing protein
MKTAADILTGAQQQVWTIAPTATVYEALALMNDKDIGALPVVDKEKKLVGILSERDYARKVVLLGKTSRQTTVEVIMTPASRVVTIPPTATLEACMSLMTAHHVRHLPVLSGEKLVGMISSRDVIGALIAEKNGFIDRLQEASDTVFAHSFDDHIAGGKG